MEGYVGDMFWIFREYFRIYFWDIWWMFWSYFWTFPTTSDWLWGFLDRNKLNLEINKTIRKQIVYLFPKMFLKNMYFQKIYISANYFRNHVDETIGPISP